MQNILLKNARRKRGVTTKEIAEAIATHEQIYLLCEQGVRDLTQKEREKIRVYLNLSDSEYQKIFVE